MLKKILIGVAVLVVIIAGGVYYLFSNLEGYIKAGIERYGSEATQAKVSVDSVTLSLSSGQGGIKGLVVGNPTGFNTKSAFELGLISLSVDVGTVRQNPVVIREIIVEGPHVTYERDLRAGNLETLQQNVGKYAGGSSGGSSSSPSSSPSSSGSSGGGSELKLIIDNLVIREGQVTGALTALQGRTISAKIPEIRLRDIGKDKGGATPAEIAQRVVSALAEASARAVASAAGGSLDSLRNAIPIPGQGGGGASGGTSSGGGVGDTVRGLLGR